MNVVEYRADEDTVAILSDFFAEADMVLAVDCSDSRANMRVPGYFVLPGGSVSKHVEVTVPA